MTVSATGRRTFPPDVPQDHNWVYNADDDAWYRQAGNSDGHTLVDFSATDVGIIGTTSGGDRRVIFAEELGVDGVDGSAVGVVTYGDRALESVGATELRSRLYADDEGGNLHGVNAETLGSGVTSGAAGLNTYADRALESVGLDERRTTVYDTSGAQKSPIGVGDVNQLVASGATAGISGSVALDLGPVRQDLDIAFETVSAGSLIADVAKQSASRQASGAPWRRLDARTIVSGGESDIHQLETAYRFARAWVSGAEDADVDLLEMAGQGVS